MTISANEKSAVVTEKKDGILLIRLNRPEAKNCVNDALAQGIDDALTELENEDDLLVGVITGEGGVFCTGFDLKGYLKGETGTTDRGFGGITRKQTEKPLIAAIEGYAVAGGMEIMLSCDLVVAADNAKFGIPEPKRGLVAAAGALIKLPKKIPYQSAMHLALTGDMIDAQRAYNLGLVCELSEPGHALDKAIALAKVLIENAPLAVKISRAIVKQGAELDEQAGWQLQDELGLPVLDTADAREGATAFAERRAPVWRGR